MSMWPSCAARSSICSLDIILAVIDHLSQKYSPREGRSDALFDFAARLISQWESKSGYLQFCLVKH